jgi:alkylhydroperoxidase family enzyme
VTAAGRPRIVPLPREEWGDDARAALATGFSEQVAARFAATGPDAVPVPNVLATLLRHPQLAGPLLAYNNVLLFTPTLAPRTRELLILRVASRTRADYEWAQHVRLAAAAGVTPNEIEAVREGATAPGWTERDAALLTAVDELVDGHSVSDRTWTRLAEDLDERQLMELVFVVGTYTALAMAFNSFGLELDPDLEPVATTARSECEE